MVWDTLVFIQTMGIIGGLWLTATASIREAKTREIENLLTIGANHRELWSGVSQNRELNRLFESNVDVLSAPPTVAEL